VRPGRSHRPTCSLKYSTHLTAGSTSRGSGIQLLFKYTRHPAEEYYEHALSHFRPCIIYHCWSVKTFNHNHESISSFGNPTQDKSSRSLAHWLTDCLYRQAIVGSKFQSILDSQTDGTFSILSTSPSAYYLLPKPFPIHLNCHRTPPSDTNIGLEK